MASFGSALAVTLLAGASASLDARSEHIVSMPMHQYKQDCGGESHLRIIPSAAALLQQDNVPGAGISKFQPFETVLKDGFLEVDCIKDYMYYRGDKFGDNRHDYKLGPVSNVSIVHYEDFVAKEDRVQMTQKVCFEFCRTVPNMGFFGIVNGRGCYCTPYFKPMESDSSICDSVCEGEQTLMCGGKSKSSIFAMHMCDSTADDVNTAANRANGLKADMDAKVQDAKTLSDGLQEGGALLQKAFGMVGDSAAADLAQAAKVFAGKLEHKAEEADKAAHNLASLAADTKGLADFTSPETVTKAERLMEGIDEAVATGEAVTDELDDLIALANHKPVHAGAAKQYYPVMYFVDKQFDEVPSTCSGDMVNQPMVGSADACASACDANIHDCVGLAFSSSMLEPISPDAPFSPTSRPDSTTPDVAAATARTSCRRRMSRRMSRRRHHSLQPAMRSSPSSRAPL